MLVMGMGMAHTLLRYREADMMSLIARSNAQRESTTTVYAIVAYDDMREPSPSSSRFASESSKVPQTCLS